MVYLKVNSSSLLLVDLFVVTFAFFAILYPPATLHGRGEPAGTIFAAVAQNFRER